jgi:pimeloyl-ACP methyl ester carboxylesterase
MSTAVLGDRIETWRLKGKPENFRSHEIHTFFQDGEGPLLILLHGFPTSSFDWRETIRLMPGQKLLAFDFLGFGLSDKPRDHNYTLSWQADLTEELATRYADGGPVYVCAHDLGTSVATELLARDSAGELGFELCGVMIFNGSILVEKANPTLAQKLLRGPFGPLAARFANEAFFRRQFASIFSEAHPVSDRDAADNWALMCFNDGNRLGHKLVSYMDERVVYADRWHGAIQRWKGDLKLAWGMEDPVAVPEVLEGLLEMRPDLVAVRFEGIGHYPQVEDPERFVEVLREFMASSRTSL